MFTGMFLADVLIDVNEGAKGYAHLRIEIPEEVITEYEWIDEAGDGAYREEFCTSTALANWYGPPVRLTEE